MLNRLRRWLSPDLAIDLGTANTLVAIQGEGVVLDPGVELIGKPFTLEPRIPLEVTADDKIDIPVSVANNTSSDFFTMPSSRLQPSLRVV